jgi:hypothetical protein
MRYVCRNIAAANFIPKAFGGVFAARKPAAKMLRGYNEHRQCGHATSVNKEWALLKSIPRKIHVMFRLKPAGFAVPVKVLVRLPIPSRKAALSRHR